MQSVTMRYKDTRRQVRVIVDDDNKIFFSARDVLRVLDADSVNPMRNVPAEWKATMSLPSNELGKS
jgi:prophage antirepressor-like protein